MSDIRLSLPLPSPTPVPSPAWIGPVRWDKAEEAAEEIIRQVQPTQVSEERRRKVIDYVQRLIRGSLGCEVFPYGSVPLKTYLPDGDIDLTAFGGMNIEEELAVDMVSVLKGKDKNGAAEFVVKDVKLIRAEVQIIKCIVQNVVVDISINQIGGVCTLCFLEQVDRLIGKDHLFKRSIILIKAWCYYESRILGAHHGLISTYGLETLVLYIFHLFHSTLDGPLAVLYKFLDYFSKFDWDNYCISLTGPVPISSLPEIVAERPENDGGDLLLSSDFLRYSIERFSVPSRGVDTGSRTFPEKYLNIVDPLKENNNLGRSVNKGNCYRIRSAFAYGARKLGQILLQPADAIADELHIFFSNTLERHGHGQRPDVQDSGLLLNTSPFSPTPDESRRNTNASSDEGFDGKLPRVGSKSCMVSGEQERSKEEYHSKKSSQTNERLVGTVRGQRHIENSEDLTSSGSSVEESVSGREMPLRYAPHLFFTKSKTSKRTDDIDSVRDDNQVVGDLAGGSNISVAPKAIPFAEDNVCTALGASGAEDPESTKTLSDLSGDFESHFSCLQYARWSFGLGMGVPVFSIPPPQPPFPMNIPWDAIPHPPHFKRNGFPHGNANGVIPSPAIFAINPLLPMPRAAFGLEDMPKPRGTGTYFPTMIRPPVGYRPSVAKGRNQPPLRSPRNHVRYALVTEPNNHDRISHELAQSEVHFDGMGHSIANGLVVQSEGVGGYGLVGQVPQGAPFVERGRQQRRPLSSPNSPISGPVSPTMGMQRVGPVFSRDHDRVSKTSLYRLKNEDDFPPLPV